MRVNDAIIGAVLIALAAALAFWSQSFPDIPGQQYGAAVFPTLIAVGLPGSGVLLIVSGMRQQRSGDRLGGLGARAPRVAQRRRDRRARSCSTSSRRTGSASS